MKLYETNQMIEELMAALQPDPETGEMPDNTDEIIAQLHSIEAEREDILRWLAEGVLNMRANNVAAKAEEDRLYKLRKDNEKVIERLIGILDRECGGQNTNFGIAKLTYRKTTSTEVSNPDKAIDFLQREGYDDVLTYKKPEVNKTKAKQLVKRGVDIPGVEVIDGYSVSLK